MTSPSPWLPASKLPIVCSHSILRASLSLLSILIALGKTAMPLAYEKVAVSWMVSPWKFKRLVMAPHRLQSNISTPDSPSKLWPLPCFSASPLPLPFLSHTCLNPHPHPGSLFLALLFQCFSLTVLTLLLSLLKSFSSLKIRCKH